MGLGPRWGSSSSSYSVPASGNPNPKLFYVVSERRLWNALIVELVYPDCTNFEGHKVLVFKDVKCVADILRQNNNMIDPHFSSDSRYVSPVARFEPTKLGRTLAEVCAKAL